MEVVSCDWKTGYAISELHHFIINYLEDLRLEEAVDAFRSKIRGKDIFSFVKYPSVRRWREVCEYKGKCDPQKLVDASICPKFPPGFPPLNYHELNFTVIQHLVDLGLMEIAEALGHYISPANQSRSTSIDYTAVESTRKWIIPFTASFSNYRPTSKAAMKFLFTSPDHDQDSEDNDPISYTVPKVTDTTEDERSYLPINYVRNVNDGRSICANIENPLSDDMIQYDSDEFDYRQGFNNHYNYSMPHDTTSNDSD